MTEPSIGEFLETRVWPELDAVSSGLVDALNPQQTGSSYKLTCPGCGKRRAFYYPTKAIRCNRIEACGYVATIWRYLIDHEGLSKKEVVERVCDAVGVSPPDNKAPQRTTEQSLDSKIVRILQDSFKDCAATLKERWNYSDDDLKHLSRYCGFYRSPEDLLSKLNPSEQAAAKKRGWIKHSLSNRFFGFWLQPTGAIGFWARALANDADPKYLFQGGMEKTSPYLVREAIPGRPLIAVEGGRDVLALKLMSFKNAVGVGGSFFNLAQCRFVAPKFNHIIHIVDGDIAGLKGIVKTLENAQEFGLRFEFVVIPSDSGMDPDDYRKEGKLEEFQRLFDRRVTAGTALGLAYAQLQADSTLQDYVGKILSVRAGLHPSDQNDFIQTLNQFGIDLDIRNEAIHDLSRLLNFFSFEEANKMIAQRYGVVIELERANSDG